MAKVAQVQAALVLTVRGHGEAAADRGDAPAGTVGITMVTLEVVAQLEELVALMVVAVAP
jgi:hypothetical protein